MLPAFRFVHNKLRNQLKNEEAAIFLKNLKHPVH